MKKVILIMLLLMSILAISACTSETDSIACTEDAKLCSDGSVVVRDAENNCEFPACPDEKNYVSSDPEECKLIKFMCAEGKRPFFNEQGCGCEPIIEEEIKPADENQVDINEQNENSGKLQAIDCPEVRTEFCTKEYVPVCGQVQVQCIKEPCLPVMQTFGNKCLACANSLTISYVEGACENGN